MGVIDEIKQRIDIVEVIGQYTSLTKSGRTLRSLCPFHSEKSPSFFVYPERQSWHCFGACSTGGDVFSFVMKKEGIDFGEALRVLAQRAGVAIPSRLEKDPDKDKRERLYQVNEAAAHYFHDSLLNSPGAEKARDYLASRGIQAKTITSFQLGFSLNSWEALKQFLMERSYNESELLDAGLAVTSENGKTHDRFRGRLMFPIRDDRGHAIGFGARVLDDSLPKYINTAQTLVFDKSGSLYGINLAAPAIRQQNIAIIVEGYMDVIAAHQSNFSNIVASMGTAITDKQVNTLKKLTKNLALALDSDTAGEAAMLRCVNYENTLSAELKVIILPEGKDPDDVIREDVSAWQKLVDKAIPVLDYAFDMVTAKLDLTTPRDKSLSVERLMPILAEIKDVVRQSHYLQKLAHLVRVSERNLEATLRKSKTSRGGRTTKPEAWAPDIRPSLSSPVEEYCLTLLLRYPELRAQSGGLLSEYFENSENLEIFLAWQQVNDLAALKEKLDVAVWQHVEALINKDIPTGQTEPKYNDCVLRLREKFLRSLEEERATALALEAETGGTAAGLAKQEEHGIEVSRQLLEISRQRTRKG